MSESALIIEALKRSLKTRGLTYRDLATKVGLSEASIKRVFSEETFTLERLETMCVAIGVSLSELVRIAADSRESRSQYLTLEQEQLLAGDQAVFHARVDPRTAASAGAPLRLSVDPARFHFFDSASGENIALRQERTK